MSLFAVVLFACTPRAAPLPPPAGEPAQVSFVHPWVVENHILAGNSTMTEGDAILMHGRKVEITASSYRSPFQGSCDSSTTDQRTRSFDDVTAEVDLAGERRTTAKNFGMTTTVTEYRLSCTSSTRTPPLVMFVAGQRAMMCFSGICYLLTPA
ncbi:hypothetical protein BH11MYX1_BH11MYX1_06250 [soil metagenome]